MQEPKVVEIKAKKLIGMNIQTSLADSKTRELWRRFMPVKKEIANNTDDNLYSLQQYNPDTSFDEFTPQTIFTSWAAVEVSDFDNTPEGLAPCTIEGGLYAVFIHFGATSTFHKTAHQIFDYWLPNSSYTLDERAHFEIMGDKYLGPDNPESQEEVWVPIINKQ